MDGVLNTSSKGNCVRRRSERSRNAKRFIEGGLDFDLFIDSEIESNDEVSNSTKTKRNYGKRKRRKSSKPLKENVGWSENSSCSDTDEQRDPDYRFGAPGRLERKNKTRRSFKPVVTSPDVEKVWSARKDQEINMGDVMKASNEGINEIETIIVSEGEMVSEDATIANETNVTDKYSTHEVEFDMDMEKAMTDFSDTSGSEVSLKVRGKKKAPPRKRKCKGKLTKGRETVVILSDDMDSNELDAEVESKGKKVDKRYVGRQHKDKKEQSLNELICDVCEVAFQTEGALQTHIQIHDSTRPYSCDICGAVFARNSDRDTHMLIHKGKNPYPCALCGKRFITRLERSQHLESHKGAKPHTCDYCLASFARKSDRDIHLRVHTGEKPYQCEICFTSFSQSAALRIHVRGHGNGKPFKCKQCNATFSQNEYLKTHVKRHQKVTRFPCTLCNAGFIARGELRNHMRTHTGERPYACTTCTAAFARNGDLIMHLRKHTGEKPYPCTACGKAFARSCTLLQHKRKNCRFKDKSGES